MTDRPSVVDEVFRSLSGECAAAGLKVGLCQRAVAPVTVDVPRGVLFRAEDASAHEQIGGRRKVEDNGVAVVLLQSIHNVLRVHWEVDRSIVGYVDQVFKSSFLLLDVVLGLLSLQNFFAENAVGN